MSDRLAVWSALDSVRGLGVRGQARLGQRLAAAGMDAVDLVGASVTQLQELGLSTKLATAASEVLVSPTANEETSVLVPGDPTYPSARHGIPPALPTLLRTEGPTSLLGRPSVGFSGSRSAAPLTIAAVDRLVEHLAEVTSFVLVSGNAAGVDARAHGAALAEGCGTVAVHAEGLDRGSLSFTGRPDRTLRISQFPPDRRWTGPQAMARNETIAALSDLVVVAAAGNSGGTLAMAEFCLKHDVPLAVFAIETDDAPSNLALVEAGALAIDVSDLAGAAQAIQEVLSHVDDQNEDPSANQGSLF